MRKVSNSVRKKKIFDVTLDELMKREKPGSVVPVVISKICDYILFNGIELEGIFRISGNLRIVEKIRTSFDKTGDADLNEDGDVMAVASCLKLFLRELPIPVIPQSLTRQFILLEEEYQESSLEEYINHLKPLLDLLSYNHYNLLQYLMYFLVKVSCFEFSNKMNAKALSIVFGPNLFRCAVGFSGLNNQATINKVVCKLILHYNEIFSTPPAPFTGNIVKIEENKSSRPAPPRPAPPPPKYVPTPPETSARLITKEPMTVTVNLDNGIINNGVVTNGDHESGTENTETKDIKIMKNNDHNQNGEEQSSPYVYESGNGYSPIDNAYTSQYEIVNRAIRRTINEQIFGDFSATTSSSEDLPEEVLELDAFVESLEMGEGYESPSLSEPTVRPLIVPPVIPPKPQKYLFKREGIESLYERTNSAFPSSKRDAEDNYTTNVKISVRHSRQPEIGRKGVSDLIQQFQSKPSSIDPGNHEGEIFTQTVIQDKNAFQIPVDHDIGQPRSVSSHDDLHDGEIYMSSSTVIPPLDLSSLNSENTEQESSHGLIPSQHRDLSNSGSMSPKDRMNTNNETEEEFNSPGADQINQLFSELTNIDAPPTPPVYQEHYKIHSNDEYANRLRFLNKKIHSTRQKLKNCEDKFAKNHGRKPSKKEKTHNPEIQRNLLELTKYKQEVKQLREDVPKHEVVSDDCNKDDTRSAIETTLNNLLTQLTCTRKEAGRPDKLEQMTQMQIQEEKLAVQKALLKFEKKHGRPMSQEDKEIMRPIYSHYKDIKHLMKSLVQTDKNLSPVPENHAVGSESQPDKSDKTDPEPDDIPARVHEQQTDLDGLSENKLTVKDTFINSLHQLSQSELKEEYKQTTKLKKDLQQKLQHFEENFVKVNLRKLQKEDRLTRWEDYLEYKRVKEKLKLLEELLSRQKSD